MSKVTNLYSRFKPATYLIDRNGDLMHVTLTGQKTGPPSRRISLHQSELKITSAKIIRFDKHGQTEIEVLRINHLPSFQEVRVHGASALYPGRYQIELDYKIKPEKLAALKTANPGRELMPSIDETKAWQSAEVEFKQ